MMNKRVPFTCLVLLVLLQMTNCLYEDQTGTYDWRQQHVGKPIFSHVDVVQNRIFVATDQQVLASLNLKTGAIIWRKIFENNDYGQIENVLWGSKEIVVITGGGQRVQGFNYLHGFLHWEYLLFNQRTEQQKTARIVGLESKQEAESYYFTNGYQICYVSLKDKVCVQLPSENGFIYDSMFETERGLTITGVKGTSIKKIQFNSLLSVILSKVDHENLNWIDANTNCLKSSDQQLVCHSSGQVFTSSIKDKLDFSTAQYTSPTNDRLKLVWSSADFVLFEAPSTSTNDYANKNLFLFKQNGELVQKYEMALSYDIVDEQFLVIAKYLGKNKLNFQVTELKNGKERADLAVSAKMLADDFKSILQFTASLVESDSSSSLSLSTFCFFDDFSMSAFSPKGQRLFLREEALAYIASVEMVDFPQLHLQEEFEEEFGTSSSDNIFSMFIKRVRTQLYMIYEFVAIDLKQKVAHLTHSAQTRTATPKAGAATTHTSTLSPDDILRDEFNMNKLIVAVTSVGKVFGLYTNENGPVLWSFHLKNTHSFQLNKLKVEKSVPLFLQRTAAHFPFEPQCALIYKLELPSSAAKTLVHFFNPLTGQKSKDSAAITLDLQIKQAFLFHTVDAQFLKPIVLLDVDNKLHVFPESARKLVLANSEDKPTVLFTTISDNNKTHSLVGLAMKNTDKPLPEMWRMSIEDETIIAIGAKPTHDRIHSHGKVLGDRSVLYKYLNPNMIAVVTTGLDAQKVSFINVYLLDTVTGATISSMNHKRCQGPVHIVHSENWFFYSFYNIKFRRFEVSSIELFEGNTQFNSTHFSSLHDVKPIVYTKSYVVQKSFDAMQVTLTEKGITTKDVIVASQFGVIYEIPWILIDSRRPLKMTEVEREENLLPYMPEMPLNYEFSLNYYNYVYNIRGITTAPSGLESTSLVFVYGLDIYFSRVFPSKTFDMLREDFDYFFISTLMVGLLLGTVLSKKLASTSNLNKAWK